MIERTIRMVFKREKNFFSFQRTRIACAGVELLSRNVVLMGIEVAIESAVSAVTYV